MLSCFHCRDLIHPKRSHVNYVCCYFLLLACEQALLGRSGGGAKMERGLKGFKPKKESHLSAFHQVLAREHNIIASLKISQSAFRIPFWDADIQFYEMRVLTPLSLFPLPPPYPWEPQESLLTG